MQVGCEMSRALGMPCVGGGALRAYGMVVLENIATGTER